MKIALLEYFVFENQISLLLVKKDLDEPLSYMIDVSESELIKHKKDFYERVRYYNPKRESKHGLKKLYDKQLDDFYTLGQKLLEPCFDVIQDVDLLYIVPHKELHYLPFHMMKIKDKYLIELYQVVYLPVASLIQFVQEKNPYRVDKSKPVSPLLYASWNDKDEEDEKRLVKQTHTKEIELVAEIFKMDSQIGLDASKESFFKQVKDSDLLHLATHGYFIDSDDVMESSGISISDGISYPPPLVYKEDIKEHKNMFISSKELLNIEIKKCHLVTLSSCSTAKSDNLAGDELMGLSRALFYAGAPSVLLTLWEVPVTSKIDFMRVFYTVWLENQAKGKSYAFREAVLELLKHEEFAVPFHWGGYCLVGDWL